MERLTDYEVGDEVTIPKDLTYTIKYFDENDDRWLVDKIKLAGKKCIISKIVTWSFGYSFVFDVVEKLDFKLKYPITHYAWSERDFINSKKEIKHEKTLIFRI